MKNVTITLSEDVARWARVLAARRDISVSRMIGEMLRREMEQELGYEAAMQTFFSRPPKRLKRKSRRYPSRDELHERG